MTRLRARPNEARLRTQNGAAFPSLPPLSPKTRARTPQANVALRRVALWLRSLSGAPPQDEAPDDSLCALAPPPGSESDEAGAGGDKGDY